MFAFTKLMQAMAAAGVVNDQYFNLTTLLLSGDGTNGAQNNTFLDSSSNNFTITRNGNTTQGTFSPFSQTGWSNYFDGSSNLTLSSAAVPSTGAFTVEAWIYITVNTSTGSQGIYTQYASADGSRMQMLFDDADKKFKLTIGASSYPSATAYSSLYNKWTHVVFQRDASSNMSIYVDGTRDSVQTVSTSITTANPMIGNRNGGGIPFYGYISNLRIGNTAVYSGTSFTVSTAPLTAITGTTLLTANTYRFVDGSASPLTITVNGTPSVQAFSPFAPTAAYSAATNGGSGYFDGSGDYISAPYNAALFPGTGDFTLEFWIYPTAISGNNMVFGTNANGLDVYRSSATGKLNVDQANVGTIVSSTANVIANTWTHYAITRSGTTVRLFVNGALDASATNSANLSNTNTPTVAASPGGTNTYTGYISGLRFVKGTAVYTSAFTTPTAPPTAITNTSLLLNFTNGGIIDATGKNVLETVGTVALSTTQKRSGSASISFPGTSGNYLKAVVSPLLRPRTADFTFECSVYFNNVTPAFGYGLIGDESLTGSLDVRWNKSDNTLRIGRVGVAFDNTFSWTPSANTWYDIEISRVSGTLYAFVNGVLIGSGANTIDYQGTASVILGATSSTDNPLNGYLDDVRYTVSKGRNSTAYTVSLPFPLQ